MSGVIRVGLIRLIGRQSPLLNTQNSISLVTPKCNISGKAVRDITVTCTRKPWNYKQKKYGLLQAIFDKTTHRLDENSKVVVVEGPIAAGKSSFAKELAAELDMLYVPPANMDTIFINPYGFDMRKLDPHLPEMCKSFDAKNFCVNPNHPLAAQFQIRMYMLRYSQYIDALAHLLSTGQGVVLDRCPYSDFVFLEAMYKRGYVSKGARSVYYEIRDNTLPELLKPHLVIYLDVPVDGVKSRIADRGLDYEKNSKAFSDAYLSDMETIYKQQYLKDISAHAELLVYDWSAVGETEVVVEDIERINFDQFEVDKHNKKMKDWRLPLEWDWCERRIKYSNQKDELLNYFNVPRFDVPELMRSADDSKTWRDIWFNAPGMKYRLGYNEDMGDDGILTKTKVELRNNL